MPERRSLWWRFVAFAFHEFYNRWAFTYDAVSKVVSLNRWGDWQKVALRYLPSAPATILEIAHGTGELQRPLHEMGYCVIGMDLSAKMGQITLRKAITHHFNPSLIRASAMQIPLMENSVDGMICTFPTGFIFDSGVWHEIHRVLRSDAKIAIVFGGALTKRNLWVSVLEWAYRITGQREGLPVGWIEELAGYGFTVELIDVALPDSIVSLIIAQKIVPQM